METKARFVLVGAFTLAAMAALLAFLLWLAQVQINRSYAQYDIVFDTVSGLGQDSVVRYNGVDVGKVLDIALDAQNPALVRVRIEINAATPVRKDTVATLSSQGVTGGVLRGPGRWQPGIGRLGRDPAFGAAGHHLQAVGRARADGCRP